VVKGSGATLRVALMRSRYGTWVFPKGTIEHDETLQQAARREIAEEIGLGRLSEIARLGSTGHDFERDGRSYAKTVDWFLFTSPEGGEPRPNVREHSQEAGWFSPEQAAGLLSHADQRGLLRRALAVLRG
jgi:8-oxo-dGTP pyrophosphatase MutT (NUDIX family)